MHGRGRLIRFKIEGESNLILPHYSTCLEIILTVWDSSPEGNSTSASSPPCQAQGDVHSSPYAYPALCPRGSVCARTALQASGSSFLAHDLQHEKWTSMFKIRWHGSLGLIDHYQRSLGSYSVSGGKSRVKHMVAFSAICK